MITELLPWVSPLEAAALERDKSYWALLYSGQQFDHTGRYSILALTPRETVKGDDFPQLAAKLSRDKAAFDNAWIGYLGYELLHRLEKLPGEASGHITLPDLWFARFGLVLHFDHLAKTVRCLRDADVPPPAWPPTGLSAQKLPAVKSITSPMTCKRYLTLVRQTREAIARGDFYQANITRKFIGEFTAAPEPLVLFERLSQASPAAYSALLCMGDTCILSSSPERFLAIDACGAMESRPIKGTAPRLADPVEDALVRTQLAISEKDRAENLMIVDLMRNDLARSAIPGSVRAERLFDVSSYATLHHMASTITGQKRPDVSTLDAVRYCFPPGSMTGAPKHRAMQWCLAHEGMRRGVYSGALGWFGGDGSCDLSVVIRTLIVQGSRFEFQVGGGIVADSEPEKEWRETLTKARGICRALGVEEKTLEAI